MSALDAFSPATKQWFASSLGNPTKVQEESWPVIKGGQHALISAPTGTGKTLAAFLVFIDQMKQQQARGQLGDKLQLIYISPLKALGNDINENLKRPLEGIGASQIQVGIRTGDTPASERQRMLRKPPHILITTPESLFLLLTSEKGRQMLKSTKAVVLDEVHALIDSKRGAHLMLSLARLDRLCGRQVQRVGLSATIRPLQLAADFLAAPQPVSIIAPEIFKDSDILVETAVPDMRVLPGKTIWPEFARQIYAQCKHYRTVIAFMEGRAQTEKLAFEINQLAQEENFARTHHSCVAKDQRLEAEQQLKRGQLRVLCATSSMELGIDVGDIDLVVQIGNPFSVSSCLQRLGRAGHNPGRTSVMYMYPRMAQETISCALTATIALQGGIEQAHPPMNCLDVLAQHLTSMAAVESYTLNEALALAHETYSFSGITKQDIHDILCMLCGDYEHDEDIPARPRVLYDRQQGLVRGDNYSRLLAVSAGGTIPDRGWFPVFLPDGTRLGELDEEFIFEARIGDKFLLGAFAWRIAEIRKDRVIVSQASTEGAQTPFWKGDGSGRDFQTALAFGRFYRQLNQAQPSGKLGQALSSLQMSVNCVENAMRHLHRQFEATGQLPDDQTIIAEHFADEAGEHQLMIHSIFGRRVNAILEMLCRERAQAQTGLDVRSYCEDEGFLLYLLGKRELPEGLLQSIDLETAQAKLLAMLPSAPIFSMVFRYNAARALMMGIRKTGRQPLWVQRIRGAETLSIAIKQAQHPLVRESLRECMDDYLDLESALFVLRAIQAGEIQVHELHTAAPSPMALPLRRQVEMEMMYDYTPTPRAAYQSTDAALHAANMIAPDPAQLQQHSQQTKPPADPDQLHSLLLTQGDLLSSEAGAPAAWLEALARQGRALYVEPGIWICKEHEELYTSALVLGETKAKTRIIRRLLRFRSPQTLESIQQRYALDEGELASILQSLLGNHTAILQGDEYYHYEIYERAQRSTVAQQRKAISTLPPEHYAAYLAQKLRTSGSPGEKLRAGIASLEGEFHPIKSWESLLLPLRCDGYRPKLLDEVLQDGEFYWQIKEGEPLQLGFLRAENIDWDAEFDLSSHDLSPDEQTLYAALKQRGASFGHALAPLLGGRSALDALTALMEKGLCHADSFAPVRNLVKAKETERLHAKKRAAVRAAVQQSGRWELSRPSKEKSLEEILRRRLEQYGILCKETAEGIAWPAALELLRVWEYTGLVRRGYFIKGLSGAQFILADGFETTLLRLQNTSTEIRWLSAADPNQAWGRILPHQPSKAFICVAGTVVGLRQGQPVALFERQGETLRVFDEAHLPEALLTFVQAFEQKRLYPELNRILVKTVEPAHRPALEQCGFLREMRDLVLWRKI